MFEKPNEVIVLILMDCDVVQEVKTFIGVDAMAAAEKAFEVYTGISHADYQAQLLAGEDADEILGDEVGTQIVKDDNPYFGSAVMGSE